MSAESRYYRKKATYEFEVFGRLDGVTILVGMFEECGFEIGGFQVLLWTIFGDAKDTVQVDLEVCKSVVYRHLELECAETGRKRCFLKLSEVFD